MNNHVSKELDRRFSEYQHMGKSMGSRSVIDLALEDYMADNPSSRVSKRLDPGFKAWVTVPIRLFLFAGHDSASSTISYCYYLSKHPEAMSKIRTEHNEVFGTDLSRATTLLREQPPLFQQLPYTLAVMKEALRLFPPAAALRGGFPGVELQDSDGSRYPAAGINIWVLHSAIQRNPSYWKDAVAFLPERWLVGPGDPLYPVKGGWRPFEFGPRNCIGQTLVTMNIRIVLTMTIRRFDVRDAYDECDRLHPSKGIKGVNDERAYQIPSGGAHPADGFPCRVSLRNEAA
jgi:Cytochrome P450